MHPQQIIEHLHRDGYHFITGVPDSVFKDLLRFVAKDVRFEHLITNNEGESCAVAAGYHLATGKIPVVYMQNSGLGNCINPITSLCDEKVYSIPTLLLMTWRGHPDEKDEPQHFRMGKILTGLLALLDIPFVIADKDPKKMEVAFKQASAHFAEHKKPFAILFQKKVIESIDSLPKPVLDPCLQTRESILKHIIDNSTPQDVIITTTGKTSRECFELREAKKQAHGCDFLTVGSMGCASSVALGVAMQQPKKRVILIDGDGACLMRLENLATIGHVSPPNLLHILIDNAAYESTGGQATLSSTVNFPDMATACGYGTSIRCDAISDLTTYLTIKTSGLTFLLLKARVYSRKNLGRPTTTPIENKDAFMRHLGLNQ